MAKKYTITEAAKYLGISRAAGVLFFPEPRPAKCIATSLWPGLPRLGLSNIFIFASLTRCVLVFIAFVFCFREVLHNSSNL
jgi:hypothetical protein